MVETYNPDRLISIFTMATFNWKIYLKQPLHVFILVIPLMKKIFNPWYDYHAGYRIKIKLIWRLRKDRD